MMISMKKTFLTIAGLVLISGGLVFAQAVAVPISKAPNADPALPMYTLPDGSSMIKYDGQIISSGNFLVNTTGSGLLNIANGLEIKRDYNDGFSWNCGPKSGYGTNPSNKCYTNYKLTNTGTPRTGYPELISMGTLNNTSSTGGVVVLGKTASAAIADRDQVFPTLTSGVKLDISGANLALQGDPAASFMNHSAGIAYPGASCNPSTNPACKKYACIENESAGPVSRQQGNIVTCSGNVDAQVNTMLSPARPACSDGIENDGTDGIDGADPQCFCPNGQYKQLWNNESTAPTATQWPCYTGPAF
jgi:hypothetical protein